MSVPSLSWQKDAFLYINGTKRCLLSPGGERVHWIRTAVRREIDGQERVVDVPAPGNKSTYLHLQTEPIAQTN
jgi:hypothetical protein